MTDKHQRGADDGFFAVHAARTGAKVAPALDIGDLANGDGNTAACGGDGVLDFIHRANPRIEPNQIAFAAAVIVVRAHREVGVLQRLAKLAIRIPRSRVSPDLVQPHECLGVPPIESTPATPGTARSCGRTIQS